MVTVVDVSHWQPPNVPWGNLYQDGVRGMFAQVSHGDFVDVGAFKHIEYAASAGVLTGLYHWLSPATTPGTTMRNQAQLFAAQIQPSWRGRLALDVEEDGLTEAMLDTFFNEWNDLSVTHSFPIIIYTRALWWNANIVGGTRAYRRFELWAAGGPGYDQPETQPPPGYAAPLPAPWSKAVLEQFTGHGRLAGYDGDLDLSLSRKTEPEFFDWWTLAGGRTVPTYTDAEVKAMADAAVTILGILKPGPPPPLPVAKHTLATLSNQQVINLFFQVFNALGQLAATGLLQGLAAARPALYTGPAVEDMLRLTDAEKQQLIAALPAPQAQG